MATVWEQRAKWYDVCGSFGLRWGPAKSALFRELEGRTLFVAIGTGADIPHLPPGHQIVALDISRRMLRRARARQSIYPGDLQLIQADVMRLPFPEDSFDVAVTSCTFCSVPDPLRGLCELYRVLRPAGRLLMFEHVRSRSPIIGLALDLMTLWMRRLGTEMNRDTVSNVIEAGFQIDRVDSVYVDIVLAIRSSKPVTELSK